MIASETVHVTVYSVASGTVHLAIFAAAAVALLMAHHVADYWVQANHQAITKPAAGWRGRWACIAHVTTYTLTCALALLIVGAVTGVGVFGWPAVAGLAGNAIAHYAADRRAPLRRVAVWLGKGDYWDNHGGAAPLDQAFHIGCLFAVALIITAGA